MFIANALPQKKKKTRKHHRNGITRWRVLPSCVFRWTHLVNNTFSNNSFFYNCFIQYRGRCCPIDGHTLGYTGHPTACVWRGDRALHDDVIKWRHFPRYWSFVRGIHRSPVNSPHKGQWREVLMFSLVCVWINDWVNNREAGDLRRHRAQYDVIVMI